MNNTYSALIYDCEIQKCIPDRDEMPDPTLAYCRGWNDHANMGISCICVWDYLAQTPRVFLPDNLAEFAALVKERETIIGFNSIRIGLEFFRRVFPKKFSAKSNQVFYSLPVRVNLRPKFQVLIPIIVPNAIDMMHGFSRLQKPSQSLFHHKAMLKHICSVARGWMLRSVNRHIAVRTLLSSTLPRLALSAGFLFGTTAAYGASVPKIAGPGERCVATFATAYPAHLASTSVRAALNHRQVTKSLPGKISQLLLGNEVAVVAATTQRFAHAQPVGANCHLCTAITKAVPKGAFAVKVPVNNNKPSKAASCQINECGHINQSIPRRVYLFDDLLCRAIEREDS